MRIEEHGQLKEITISVKDINDLKVTPYLQVLYKGKVVNLVQAVQIMLPPTELKDQSYDGLNELMHDLGVQRGS